MRKRYSTLLFLFLTLSPFSFSQTEKVNFLKIDFYAKSVKGINDIGKLSHKLTSPYDTDLKKTRSIFRWITENIAYDTQEYHADSAHSVHYQIFNKISDDVKNKDEEFNYQLIQYILKNKKAICEGYSILFKALCDSANIKAEVIVGKSKNSISKVGVPSKEDHAWNAVYIDDKWALLDVTWASGGCNDSTTKFSKKFNESYFLTAPTKFIINHYPTDKKWFLIPNPPTENQFYSYPLVYSGYFKNNISSFSPTNGIIEGKIGNKITFEIKTPDEGSSITVQTAKGNNGVMMKRQEKIITYEYTVSSDKDDELTIYLNREAVFAYRIIVVPEK